MENTETKVCSCCKHEKSISLYNKDARSPDMLCCYCRECSQEKAKSNYKKHREKRLLSVLEYYNKNKIKINEEKALRRMENIEEIRNREIQYEREYRKKYRYKIIDKQRKYRSKNKDKVNKYYRERYKKPNVKIEMLLRNRIRIAVTSQNIGKYYKSVEILGCSVDECRKYLESKFLPGMTWDNHGFGEGRWHIDHIIPCASFDLAKPEEQLKCFHYTNLQPLWHNENLSKSDKIQVLTSEGVFFV